MPWECFHGNMAKARVQLNAALWGVSGSLCLVGNDDNSTECWIKLNWGWLTPSYCRERRQHSSPLQSRLLSFFFSLPSQFPYTALQHASILIALVFVIGIGCIALWETCDRQQHISEHTETLGSSTMTGNPQVFGCEGQVWEQWAVACVPVQTSFNYSNLGYNIISDTCKTLLPLTAVAACLSYKWKISVPSCSDCGLSRERLFDPVSPLAVRNLPSNETPACAHAGADTCTCALFSVRRQVPRSFENPPLYQILTGRNRNSLELKMSH